MLTRASPMDIATSSSNRIPHTSNLTSALQMTTGNEARPSSAVNKSHGADSEGGPRDSFFGNGGAPESYSAAQPIFMKGQKPRRESSAAGSMATGMSLSGNSVSSAIHEILMRGTSPSPSFHSSSYMPKFETQFMSNFLCCDSMFPNLHELMGHYETFHPEQLPGSMSIQNQRQVSAPDPKAAIAAGAAAAVRDPTRAQQSQQEPNHASLEAQKAQQQAWQTIHGFAPPPTPIVGEEEAVGDMEMDDGYPADTTSSQYAPQQPMITHQSQFGRQTNCVPPLDTHALNMSNMQPKHQGLRISTPTTPVSAGRNSTFYQHNPTVSSVNTPTFGTNSNGHPLQQHYTSPDSSAPGTPDELDNGFVGDMSHMTVEANNQHFQNPMNGNYGFVNRHPEFLDTCIDEPAKRLYSPNGEYANPTAPVPETSTSATQMGDAQYGEDSELAITIREEQKLAGVPDPVADGIPKPFYCPVIGCEKAYKNHNGLKYHKGHGHNTQKLKANENGTFSILDPATNRPYLGIRGIEKYKPYRCESCGKRYKNLNGLKYHKGHSRKCDPEIRNPFPNAGPSSGSSRDSKNIPPAPNTSWKIV